MNANQPPSLYGVIGNPITQSLSPLLHNTAFQHLDLPGILLPWCIVPEKVPAFVDSVRLLNIKGVAVTLPHKSAVLTLADCATQQAKQVGAANTLYWENGQLCADNTDVAGFAYPLTKLSLPRSGKALMLGAGGAARAGIVGLLDYGITTIFVTSPSGTTADRLADEFDIVSIPWKTRGDIDVDMVINSTPSGMMGKSTNDSPYPTESWHKRVGVAYDMIYTPLHTRFLQEAREAGWKIVTGLEMFIGQANHQFRTWTGNDLPACAIEAVSTALYGDELRVQ